MSASLTDPAPATLAPVAARERIQALDVIRGFALIGILLMNVEFFSRPLLELGSGLPPSLTGIDRIVGWLIYIFVQGKFWTMFSLLFGMGFAVMLTRAEQAGRDFLPPYLRRIAALAVFGAAHHVFIWGGDILFSYAVGAAGLLVLLYARWHAIVGAMLAVIALGMWPPLATLRAAIGPLAFLALAAWFLRSDRSLGLAGRRMPVFSLVILLLGLLMAVAAAALWFMPQAPADARLPLSIGAVLVLLIGVGSAWAHQPVSLRSRRLGVGMYLVPFVAMLLFGIGQFLVPASAATPAAPVPTIETQAAGAKAEPTPAQARQAAGAAQVRETEEERRLLSSGSYAEVVDYRAREFADGIGEEAGFATIVIGMFLIGAWFVRSGVMDDIDAHLPLFRRLALFGIPVGVGLGLLGSLIATAPTPGLERDPYLIAMGLMYLGNLPACLGYVGLVVLMLHSRSGWSRIAVLAPLGRMALTNYIAQTSIGVLFFYHHGFGLWGMGRAWQVVFALVVVVLQLLWSTWWLARFRYGPLEWLWRAVTYWQWPTMRVAQDATVARAAAV